MTKVKGEKVRHVPMRTCIATGVKRPKKELLRLVQDPETGKVTIDLKNKIRARGANVDMNENAFDTMVKKKALPRALKLEKNLTNEEYITLKQEFLDAIEEKKFREGNRPVKIRVTKAELKKINNN